MYIVNTIEFCQRHMRFRIRDPILPRKWSIADEESLFSSIAVRHGEDVIVVGMKCNKCLDEDGRDE